MAKSQFKANQKNNYNQQGKPYGRNHGDNNNYNNRKLNNNNVNRNSSNKQQHQQQRNRIAKPKEIPINHSIKGPLFDKSKLVPAWKFNRQVGPGLINGHNTCFLNSVLECLTYTAPLAQYLLREEHKKSCRSDGYCALCAMELHIRRCFKDPKSFSKGAAILPSYFTSNLKIISKTLRLGRQEDAHEFYILLLSAFQKSSIAGLGKLPPKVEETTLIHQVYGGKLRSQLKCYNCKTTSNNYEACLDLSVDLNNHANTLEHTLNNFIKVDHIEGYRCDSCKQIVKAGKQMTINEPPMMLTVHLKRFAFDLHSGDMRKISRHVDFSEKLDLAPYMSKDKKVGKLNYSLYAVLVHYGYGCNSGHYYAFVKAPNGQWYCMDDESVQATTIEEVMKENAYMLFYQQEQTTSKHIPEPEPTPMEIVVEESPVVTLKKAIRDKQVVKPKDTRRVIIEQNVISDSPASWVTQSSEKPHRSLRGNLSPPTYSAAVSDESSWDINDLYSYLLKQKLPKKRVFRKNLESKKSPWMINPF